MRSRLYFPTVVTLIVLSGCPASEQSTGRKTVEPGLEAAFQDYWDAVSNSLTHAKAGEHIPFHDLSQSWQLLHPDVKARNSVSAFQDQQERWMREPARDNRWIIETIIDNASIEGETAHGNRTFKRLEMLGKCRRGRLRPSRHRGVCRECSL